LAHCGLWAHNATREIAVWNLGSDLRLGFGSLRVPKERDGHGRRDNN